MSEKLSDGHKHILRLIQRDADTEGWTKVSRQVASIFTDKEMVGGPMPPELCEFEPLNEGGRVRLTQAGHNLLDAMAWL